MALKYVYTVVYRDGSVYQQNLEDKSALHPTGSCFADLDLPNIRTFTLVGVGHRYTVDLTDGHFDIDGVPFCFHDRSVKLPDLQLWFFRRHTHEVVDGVEKSHRTEYRMGWTTVDGLQRVMEID